LTVVVPPLNYVRYFLTYFDITSTWQCASRTKRQLDAILSLAAAAAAATATSGDAIKVNCQSEAALSPAEDTATEATKELLLTDNRKQ